MPTLIELATDPSSVAIFAIYGTLMLVERVFPARPLPFKWRWKVTGLFTFALYFLISSYLPFLWANSIAGLQLFDLKNLPTFFAAPIGIVVYEFFVYVWHRSMHKSDFLWRFFHRKHHSAERLDTYGAFYFSLPDMVGWTTLFSLALTIMGLSAQATMWVIIATTFLSIFQHSNIRTAQWIGYFVQRPESHSHHHAKGLHRDNYSDLPLFDMLFDTYNNPQGFAPDVGGV